MLNYGKTLLQRLGLYNPRGSIILLLVAIVVLDFVLKRTNLLQMGGGSVGSATTNSGGGAGVKKLVLYYAPWCGYCKKLKPTWAQLEQAYDGKVVAGKTIKIEKVNGDEEKSVVQALNIDGFPTIVLHKDDGSKVTYSGDRSYEDLVTFINN